MFCRRYGIMPKSKPFTEEEPILTISWIGILLGGWGVLANLSGLILMAADKSRARRGTWRISEKTFFLLALLGGSLGCWAGMYLFHHKTRHWYFVVGMPLILAAQFLLVWWVKNCLV